MTPQGFENRVNVWRVKLAPLGLSHWRFNFDYSDDALEDHQGREADASVRVHESYDTAWWQVSPATLEQEDADLDVTIVHELLHVAFRDLNSVEFDLMHEVGGRMADAYSDRLTTANEQVIERLARAIVMVSAIVVP